MELPKKFKNKGEDLFLNNATYNDYLLRLLNLSLSRFEWVGLPSEIDERFLEICLLYNGACLFFYDDVMGFSVMKCAPSGTYDIYNNPLKRFAYAITGYNKQFNKKNSVIIYNNYLRTNSILTLTLYAKRLEEIQRTIDININAQKTPLILQCEEKQRLSIENLYKKYEGNAPVIFGGENLDLNSIKVLNTNAPFVADKLTLQKHELWNEILSYLGIENSNTDKKERLIPDEVNANNGDVEMQRFTNLNSRLQACKQINEMFGLAISVKFRNEESEGKENGNIYNGIEEIN